MQTQSDPFVRKRTVRIISILDQGFAGLLLVYAGFRLIIPEYRDQTVIILIDETGHQNYSILAIIVWLGVFALIGLQLVIAFLLLAATKDMTIDPETMMKKCHFWRNFSVILLIFLILDTVIATFIYIAGTYKNEGLILAIIILHAGEMLFRIIGLYVVSRFIADLHTLFGAPIEHSATSTPVLPRRTSSMRSSVRSAALPLPRDREQV